MPDYAIGDVQGCFEPLIRLLDHINFDENRDRLWFVGDLVNRGPQSLEVLRFIKNLPVKPQITLGNHDLYLLLKIFTKQPWSNHDDTLQPVLAASDREALGHWLRKQSLLVHDASLGVVMCHAGIAPAWDLDAAKACARELEHALASDNFVDFLCGMYGNEPACWSADLKGQARLRIITNFFTRMRFCDIQGCLSLACKRAPSDAPPGLFPWFEVPGRRPVHEDIVFGHWAALEGKSIVERVFPIDTGCFWGGELTALRLQDRQRFSVKGQTVI